MQRWGWFITFEGIDGAGKSSHIETVAEVLRREGRTVTVTREPGGTPLAETLRGLLLHVAMDALTEALIVFAGRRDHLRTVIAPALERGETVLCDRFTDATFAYQGAGRGFDSEVLSTLEQITQLGLRVADEPVLKPDLTFWFDTSAEIAAGRLSDARAPDRFEAQPVAFFRRVAQGYADRAAADPGRFARLDAGQPREAVQAQLLAVLRSRGVLQREGHCA